MILSKKDLLFVYLALNNFLYIFNISHMSIKIKKNYNFLAFVNQKSVSVFKIHLNSCNYTFACIFYFGANYSLMILPCPRFFSLSAHSLFLRVRGIVVFSSYVPACQAC